MSERTEAGDVARLWMGWTPPEARELYDALRKSYHGSPAILEQLRSLSRFLDTHGGGL